MIMPMPSCLPFQFIARLPDPYELHKSYNAHKAASANKACEIPSHHTLRIALHTRNIGHIQDFTSHFVFLYLSGWQVELVLLPTLQ